MGLAGKTSGVGRLVAKIQLHGGHDQQLLYGLFQIKFPKPGGSNRRQNLKHLGILLKQLLDPGQAHLDRHIGAIFQARPVHLGDGGHCHRVLVNPAKSVTPVSTKGFFQGSFNL